MLAFSRSDYDYVNNFWKQKTRNELSRIREETEKSRTWEASQRIAETIYFHAYNIPMQLSVIYKRFTVMVVRNVTGPVKRLVYRNDNGFLTQKFKIL